MNKHVFNAAVCRDIEESPEVFRRTWTCGIFCFVVSTGGSLMFARSSCNNTVFMDAKGFRMAVIDWITHHALVKTVAGTFEVLEWPLDCLYGQQA